MSIPKVESRISLTTIISTLTLLGMLWGTFGLFYPLRNLPEKQERFADDLHVIRQTQAIQTEALKTLAEVAKESTAARRDIDVLTERTSATARRHDAELNQIKHRLNRLEQPRQ